MGEGRVPAKWPRRGPPRHWWSLRACFPDPFGLLVLLLGLAILSAMAPTEVAGASTARKSTGSTAPNCAPATTQGCQRISEKVAGGRITLKPLEMRVYLHQACPGSGSNCPPNQKVWKGSFSNIQLMDNRGTGRGWGVWLQIDPYPEPFPKAPADGVLITPTQPKPINNHPPKPWPHQRKPFHLCSRQHCYGLIMNAVQGTGFAGWSVGFSIAFSSKNVEKNSKSRPMVEIDAVLKQKPYQKPSRCGDEGCYPKKKRGHGPPKVGAG